MSNKSAISNVDYIVELPPDLAAKLDMLSSGADTDPIYDYQYAGKL